MSETNHDEKTTALLEELIEIVKGIGYLPKFVDIMFAELFPRDFFGGFHVDHARTISSHCGEEQMKQLEEDKKSGKWDGKNPDYYPWIPLNHPFSQLFMTVCEGVQPYHGLVSIDWAAVKDKAEEEYPSIYNDWKDYLALKGVSV